MAKLCRACQQLLADRGGVCASCRRRILKDSPAPAPRLGLWKWAGLVVILISVSSSLIAAAVLTHQIPPWRHASNRQARLPTPPGVYETMVVVVQGTRKVYPYSIVPGGALSLDEAKQAMNDPAVKANYVKIDFAKLRQVKLRADLPGFVSYRWGDKIYWTSKEQTLRAGEIVFTDGVRLVRGRCLNCYSAHAILPIRTDEPTEKVLDTPVEMPVIAYSFPKLPVVTPELPPSPEELTPTVPILPPAMALTPGVPGGGFWFPILPIIPPVHRYSGHLPPGIPLPPQW